jgi:hypothetical protein
MDKYFKAIKQNVCSICIDSNEKGACTLTQQETCAVELYFPLIVEIIRGIQSENIDEYRSKIHETICIGCRAQDESGNCYLHDDANCSLDRYLPIIVETIKKVELGKL